MRSVAANAMVPGRQPATVLGWRRSGCRWPGTSRPRLAVPLVHRRRPRHAHGSFVLGLICEAGWWFHRHLIEPFVGWWLGLPPVAGVAMRLRLPPRLALQLLIFPPR
jgi:hypothetical protein